MGDEDAEEPERRRDREGGGEDDHQHPLIGARQRLVEFGHRRDSARSPRRQPLLDALALEELAVDEDLAPDRPAERSHDGAAEEYEEPRDLSWKRRSTT